MLSKGDREFYLDAGRNSTGLQPDFSGGKRVAVHSCTKNMTLRASLDLDILNL